MQLSGSTYAKKKTWNDAETINMTSAQDEFMCRHATHACVNPIEPIPKQIVTANFTITSTGSPPLTTATDPKICVTK